MRFNLGTLAITLTLAANPAGSQELAEVKTAAGAILCLSAENVAVANRPSISRNQTVLSRMGCLRVGAGIDSRMLDDPTSSGPIRVRFYPAGISDGLVLWALPSSFLGRDRDAPGPGTSHVSIR
jgi:hypothetical protein